MKPTILEGQTYVRRYCDWTSEL